MFESVDRYLGRQNLGAYNEKLRLDCFITVVRILFFVGLIRDTERILIDMRDIVDA